MTINANGKNDKVEVTLKDVNIEANSGHALTSNGDVTLTLKGETISPVVTAAATAAAASPVTAASPSPAAKMTA